MNKIDKFRGLLELKLGDETFLLDSLKVNDLFDLLLLNKKENGFEFGVQMLYRIFEKSFPDDVMDLDDKIGLEVFVIENYVELIEEIMIALEWTTREKIEEAKLERENPKKVEKGFAAMKARAALEANAVGIEDKYITTCYILMREFKYTRDEILDMDASVFLIIIDEMNKQAKKEEEEMKKARRKG